MSSPRYSPEFKHEAVRQVLECFYFVTEVSERLDVSVHSLYKLAKAVEPGKSVELNEEPKQAKREILKLRAELLRAGVFDYIQVFYNRQRGHRHLGGTAQRPSRRPHFKAGGSP